MDTNWSKRVRPALWALALAVSTWPFDGAALAAAGSASLRALEQGARVEVKGRFLDDGRFAADEIELRKQETDDDEEIRANIDSFDPSGRSLVALGIRVHLPEQVEVSRDVGGTADLDDLTIGTRVKIDGYRNALGEFVAEKIRIRERQYTERKLVARVESARREGRRVILEMMGFEIVLDDSTEFEGFPARAGPITRRLGVLDDDDVRLGNRFRIGDFARIGGELRVRAEALHNPDLDSDTEDHEIVPEINGVVGLAANLGRVFAYVEVNAGREFFLDGSDAADASREDRSTLRAGEAYLEITDLFWDRVSIAIGRQKFNEEREWFYNTQKLDAVRVLAAMGPVRVEASVSKDLFDKSRNFRDQEITNVIVRAESEPTEDLLLEGYYISRNDSGPDRISPVFWGFRALGEIGRHLEFWTDGALQRGDRGVRNASGLIVSAPIRAEAYDVGLTLRPRWKSDPTLTVSHAFGSGDDRVLETDGVDGTFRQTDLERNRHKYNGVVSFRYYGEVVDPELTNLNIFTLGLGFRPNPSTSLDFVYHRYQQDVAVPDLDGTDLEQDPDGLNTDLGREIDLVFGFEPRRSLELRLTAGYFDPGDAFAADADAAAVVRFQSKFRF